MKKIQTVLVFILAVTSFSYADARTVRATEVTPQMLTYAANGSAEEIIIEFRQGDRLPVNIEFQGDFLETAQPATGYVAVKQNFWLKPQPNSIQASLDGRVFKNVSDLMKGSLEAGAGSGDGSGTATALQLLLKAYLK